MGKPRTQSLTEYDTANGSEHEHQGDAPGDIGGAPVEGLGQIGHGQTDGEEIKGIPRPTKEPNEEE